MNNEAFQISIQWKISWTPYMDLNTATCFVFYIRPFMVYIRVRCKGAHTVKDFCNIVRVHINNLILHSSSSSLCFTYYLYFPLLENFTVNYSDYFYFFLNHFLFCNWKSILGIVDLIDGFLQQSYIKLLWTFLFKSALVHT